MSAVLIFLLCRIALSQNVKPLGAACTPGQGNLSLGAALTNVDVAPTGAPPIQFFCSSVLAWPNFSAQIASLGVQLEGPGPVTARLIAYSVSPILQDPQFLLAYTDFPCTLDQLWNGSTVLQYCPVLASVTMPPLQQFVVCVWLPTAQANQTSFVASGTLQGYAGGSMDGLDANPPLPFIRNESNYTVHQYYPGAPLTAGATPLQCGRCVPGYWDPGYVNFSISDFCIPKTNCTDGDFIANYYNPSNDTTCAKCSQCNFSFQYEAVPCSEMNDTNCVQCATCPPLAFIAAPCTNQSNTVVQNCTPCPNGTVLVGGCGFDTSQDSVCATTSSIQYCDNCLLGGGYWCSSSLYNNSIAFGTCSDVAPCQNFTFSRIVYCENNNSVIIQNVTDSSFQYNLLSSINVKMNNMPAFYQRCGQSQQVVNITYNNGTDFSITLGIVMRFGCSTVNPNTTFYGDMCTVAQGPFSLLANISLSRISCFVSPLSQIDSAVFSGNVSLTIAEPVPLYPTNTEYQFILGNLNACSRPGGIVFALIQIILYWTLLGY